MSRAKVLPFSLALALLLVACSGGDDTTTNDIGAVNDQVSRTGSCNLPPPPTTEIPIGCSFNSGSGWVSVPCACDLWIANTSEASTATRIAITITPDPADGMTLAPGQAPGADIAFDDPDASWYAVWKAQSAEAGFSVTNSAGTTTVSVTTDVTLAPVPLAACLTRKANTTVLGSKVTMAATTNGTDIATMSNCLSPGPH